jgi:hypothetical protein
VPKLEAFAWSDFRTGYSHLGKCAIVWIPYLYRNGDMTPVLNPNYSKQKPQVHAIGPSQHHDPKRSLLYDLDKLR